MNQLVLLSIKPNFVEKILNGEKTIELRKCKPNAKKNDILIIYSTKPVKSVVGIALVENIYDSKPEIIWEQYSQNLGVTNEEFWDYYKNANRSIAISFKLLCRLPVWMHLDDIKRIQPDFSPPQTFFYLSKMKFLRFCSFYKKTHSINNIWNI